MLSIPQFQTNPPFTESLYDYTRNKNIVYSYVVYCEFYINSTKTNYFKSLTILLHSK